MKYVKSIIIIISIKQRLRTLETCTAYSQVKITFFTLRIELDYACHMEKPTLLVILLMNYTSDISIKTSVWREWASYEKFNLPIQ
jgi:hypothetical protein